MNMGMRIVAVLLPLVGSACIKASPSEAAAPGNCTVTQSPEPDPQLEPLRLESLYMNTSVRFTNDAPAARTVSLTLAGRTGSELMGTLLLDPNTCTLDRFGDREACTRIAVRGIDVDLQLVRVSDPARLGRRLYQVSGEGLPKDLALIVRGDLVRGELERAYLKLGVELVPLHVEARQ